MEWRRRLVNSVCEVCGCQKGNNSGPCTEDKGDGDGMKWREGRKEPRKGARCRMGKSASAAVFSEGRHFVQPTSTLNAINTRDCMCY